MGRKIRSFLIAFFLKSKRSARNSSAKISKFCALLKISPAPLCALKAGNARIWLRARREISGEIYRFF